MHLVSFFFFKGGGGGGLIPAMDYESSIQPSLHWTNPTSPSPYEVWVGVAGSSSSKSCTKLDFDWCRGLLERHQRDCIYI